MIVILPETRRFFPFLCHIKSISSRVNVADLSHATKYTQIFSQALDIKIHASETERGTDSERFSITEKRKICLASC